MRKKKDDITSAHLKVCHYCDLVQHTPTFSGAKTVRCARCHSVITKHRSNSLERSLALAVTGLIFFIVSNLYPLLSIKAGGLVLDASLLSSSIELYKIDHPFLGLLVLLTTFIFPLLSLLGIIYILTIIKLNRYSTFIPPFFRFLRRTEIWGMLEVFLLALIVAGVKLADMVTVIPGISLYSFFSLIIILAWLNTTLEPEKVWERSYEPKVS